MERSNVEVWAGEHGIERRREASARPHHCHVMPQTQLATPSLETQARPGDT